MCRLYCLYVLAFTIRIGNEPVALVAFVPLNEFESAIAKSATVINAAAGIDFPSIVEVVVIGDGVANIVYSAVEKVVLLEVYASDFEICGYGKGGHAVFDTVCAHQ